MRIWTEFRTPVKDDGGMPIAVLMIGQEAQGPFSRILQMAQLGETGETYAFNAFGLMLSESRFTESLRELEMLPELTGELDWDRNALLNVQVRDPGGDLARGFVPELDVDARPLTKLAALAVAARNAEEDGALDGVVTTPYRNYRGVDVIGAWRWLPEYGVGVATEIEASEAFAPLRYLNGIIGLLFVLMAIAVAGTFASSFSVLRLRQRVTELRQLGPYRLLKPLGRGGMGQVFLAEHALLKRPTAVKTLPLENLTEENIARFEREVRLSSQLEHPNTIEIYDYGRTPDNVLYYAMEYLDGLNLGELVSQHGAVPPGRVIHILRQACGSLQEAHEKGLLHRDIKPLNIMLCEKGGVLDVVKVLDFGLVKPIDQDASRDLTGKTQVGGTPMYMSPERLTAPETVDARSDVYSLGAVAYYLLSGATLFPYESVELLHHVVNEEPKPLTQMCEGVPHPLADLVMRCLSKEPDERPESAAALSGGLRVLAAELPWDGEDALRFWRDRRPGKEGL